jgi:hypothetical protein
MEREHLAVPGHLSYRLEAGPITIGRAARGQIPSAARLALETATRKAAAADRADDLFGFTAIRIGAYRLD